MDWSIEIEAEANHLLDKDLADQVIEALADHGAAVAQGEGHLSVRFDVWAANEYEASKAGMAAFRRVLPDLTPVRVEVETVDELERRLG